MSSGRRGGFQDLLSVAAEAPALSGQKALPTLSLCLRPHPGPSMRMGQV